MSFIFTEDRTFEWPVELHVPTAGSFDTIKITGTFQIIDDTEFLAPNPDVTKAGRKAMRWALTTRHWPPHRKTSGNSCSSARTAWQSTKPIWPRSRRIRATARETEASRGSDLGRGTKPRNRGRRLCGPL